MSEPTEADRERAEAICVDMPGVSFEDSGESWGRQVAYVAQVLADERERARAVTPHCDRCLHVKSGRDDIDYEAWYWTLDDDTPLARDNNRDEVK